MEIYTLAADLKLIGSRVKTFPAGIGEAFDAMIKTLPDGESRSYYGFSNMDAGGNTGYYAAAAEKFPEEAGKYGYERHAIPKGDYLTVSVTGWRTKTACIKDVFHEMMQDERYDNTKPCIEWYKNDDEMICMLYADPEKLLLTAIADEAAELQALFSPLNEEQINAIPFTDSWTAAQLATHITKSNRAMAQALEMEGRPTERSSSQRAQELRDTFLDFTVRYTSPAFIVPAPGYYKKEDVTDALQQSFNSIKKYASEATIADMINLPLFGEITKLELLHFVCYHTRRHIHQLQNILTYL
ncbi:MAG: DinB family protein [Chitinophagaceae bacterium]